MSVIIRVLNKNSLLYVSIFDFHEFFEYINKHYFLFLQMYIQEGM